jgi:galactokinase
MSLGQLQREADSEFERRFGRAPRFIGAAPGRVNLIGEHTDYHGGFVLPMALELSTVIVADLAERGSRRIRLETTAGFPAADLDLGQPPVAGPPEWANYCRGVIAGFLHLGAGVPGFDALIHSDLPVGGGLSSSAALAVATASLLQAITGQVLEPLDKARLCLRAEQEFAGLPCGIMDQFVAVMGHPEELLLIDCRAETAERVPFNDPSVAVLIIDTGVRHSLVAEGAYARRRAECDDAARMLGVPSLRDATLEGLAPLGRTSSHPDRVIARRARHVVTENQRTLEAAVAVRRRDWARVGELMYASHASLRDDFEVSCRELDVLVEIASAIGVDGGVFGSRLTGGGFGGCTVTLVRTDSAADIRARLFEGYQRATGRSATSFG